jgi:hypothetical protein
MLRQPAKEVIIVPLSSAVPSVEMALNVRANQL